MWKFGLMAAGAAMATVATMPAPAADAITWRGRSSTAVAVEGGFILRAPDAEVPIGVPPLRSDTASPMFAALFALAQQELGQAKVAAIRDDAFAAGEPIDCACFETGEKWPYVWTRDMSYAADLALARLEPARTRNALRFKLGAVRDAALPPGRAVAQDTGSGGSWPVSTDRVVWFLGARHLLDDRAFADEMWPVLVDTLAQERAYAFDPEIGLYRGETSFLDWREQSYPAWTREDVTFIAESFALSTNVLHYEALRLAARMAGDRDDDARARAFQAQAAALRSAIDARFWREDRGLYMSYIGPAAHPVPFEAYDLLGIALAITSGVAPPERARRALANYPTLASGSPVIWPQQPDVAIYHNRAIWPFVSAYALRAAREVDDTARIEHEIRSLMRGAALAGSNMENYELVTQAVHVEDGALSGPVVNSRRQLWSVAGYLDMVLQGVFGLEPDGGIAPKLPRALASDLFGERDRIALHLPGRDVVLLRPQAGEGDLLVAGTVEVRPGEVRVQLVPRATAPRSPSPLDAAAFAPPSPDGPDVHEGRVRVPRGTRLYVDGRGVAPAADDSTFVPGAGTHCLSLTRVGEGGIESLHGPIRCVGPQQRIDGPPPYAWTAPAGGRYRVRLEYANPSGPINTGITAAVKRWRVECGGHPVQAGPVVMPHSVGLQASTAWTFELPAGVACTFALDAGFNMSALDHFARYTGGAGGAEGPHNAADIQALVLTPVTGAHEEHDR